MSAEPEVVAETRYTRTVAVHSGGGGPTYRKETLRCALCETPRADWPRGEFPRHLEADCPGWSV